MNSVTRMLIILVFISASVSAQEKVIDFKTTDAKGLTPSQLREWNASRDRFFNRLQKTSGYMSEIKSLVIQGNKIKTIIYNTSSISRPGITPNVLDLVWNGLGYGYEFGPLVGSKVPKEGSLVDSLKIVSEGFYAPADGSYSPDGSTKWGWLPKTGYSAPGQPDIASWGARAKVGNDLRLRPPSWPESWYNSVLGEYVYPSYLGGNSTVPDEEVYFVDDDWTKKEFQYYPDPSDTNKRGLGVNLEVRTFQYSNPLAEDIIFLVYTVENASPKTLGKVFFGMFGDPHIGGANNYSDDAASFIPARQGTEFKGGQDLTFVNGVLTSARSRNLVYAWDPDGKSDIATIAPGYFGYKFLESPSNSTDRIDNDDDGIVDESPFNDKGTYIDGVTVDLKTGIDDVTKYTAIYGAPKPRWSGDENGNWDPTRDDLGIDGIAGTHDFGEGNGVPDQVIGADGKWLGSEPNFGFHDVNESDQIGLKSFWALVFGGTNRPYNNTLMYDKISSDMDSTAFDLLYPPTMGDNIFLFSCGAFELKQGDRQRFSIALMMAQNLNDLLLNSETAQRVLEANYRFAQPPPKPHVVAVPGDKRVTLYWDTAAEEGIDPLLNVNDFEGYKIYRSEDYTFSDVFVITDAYGVPFLGRAMFDVNAKKYAQWHLPWSDSLKAVYVGGLHPVEYPDRFVKYYMGDPSDMSGLRHQFVDSTVTNGKTYFYAVVAFDHGAMNTSIQLSPTETPAVISRNPMNQEFLYDVNTVGVIPGSVPGADSAMLSGALSLAHTNGNGTGLVRFQALDPKQMQNASYRLSFKKIVVGRDSLLAYDLLRTTQVSETVSGSDTAGIRLRYKNIVKSSVTVIGPENKPVIPSLIVVDSVEGWIRSVSPGILKNQTSYTVSYQYYPVVKSTSLKGEDNNQVFDGIRPYVYDDQLALDPARSGLRDEKTMWGVQASVGKSTVGVTRLAPIDVKITFMKALGDTTATGAYTIPVDSLKPTAGSIFVKVPFKIENATDAIPLTVLIKEVTGTKGRWDVGDEIVVLTPPPYNQSSTNVMESIYFTSTPPVGGTVMPMIAAGTVFVARMKKPYSTNDTYVLSTQSVTSVENPEAIIPAEYSLSHNYPNPFNPSTTITYSIPRSEKVRITVFTVLGQEVAMLVDNVRAAGTHSVAFKAGRLASGVYIYRIDAGPFTAVKKMIMLK